MDGKLEEGEARLDTVDSVGREVSERENDWDAVVDELAIELVKIVTEDGAVYAAASKSVRFDKFSVGNIPPVFEQVSTN